MANPRGAYGKSGRKIGVKFGSTGKSVPMSTDRVAKSRRGEVELYEDNSIRRRVPKGTRRSK